MSEITWHRVNPNNHPDPNGVETWTTRIADGRFYVAGKLPSWAVNGEAWNLHGFDADGTLVTGTDCSSLDDVKSVVAEWEANRYGV